MSRSSRPDRKSLTASYRFDRSEWEGSLQEDSHTKDLLPPFWQVIYHEGIRANHIIFAPDELSAIESDLMAGKLLPLTETQTTQVEEIGSQLFLCTDLMTMRRAIAPLVFEQKKYLYLLYRRALTAWASYIRNNLN